MVRCGSGFIIEFGPEIPLLRTGDKTRDVADNTAQYNQVLEGFVRRYPEQWFWVHQRWKTRPHSPWPRSTAR
jgi:KDO2-lipid IV(A) lauroyltransferase